MSAVEATAASANEESGAPAEKEEARVTGEEKEARAGVDGGAARVEKRGDETRKGAARETEGAEAEAVTGECARSEEVVSVVRS